MSRVLRRGLRSRALIVGPAAKYEPDDAEGGSRLQLELQGEIERLKEQFAEEWEYFGDVPEADLVRRVVGRNEPAWFADLISPQPSNSIHALSAALGQTWEYDYLYEAWSAFAHGRGISKDVTTNGDSVEVHHPHRPTWFTMVAFLSLGWHAQLLMTAAKWLHPEMIGDLQQLHRAHQAAINALEPDEDIYSEFID